jgi:hypothetical protein
MIVDSGGFQDAASGGWNENVIVVCDRPTLAAEALLRAAPRICLVGTDGVEYTADGLEIAEANGIVDVCKYVSEPQRCERGAFVYLDARGEALPEGIARRFFEIIRDELVAVGVTSARVDAPTEFDRYSVGRGAFLRAADAIELSPVPRVETLLGTIERSMPDGSILVFDGATALSRSWEARDRTLIRPPFTRRIAIEPESMRALDEALAVPPEPIEDAPLPVGLNWSLIYDVVGNRAEPTEETMRAFWHTVNMYVGAPSSPASAAPTRELMHRLSAGEVPFDHHAWRAMRDGAVAVAQDQWRARNEGAAAGARTLSNLLVLHKKDVLLLAPEPASLGRYWLNRTLAPRVIDSFKAL